MASVRSVAYAVMMNAVSVMARQFREFSEIYAVGSDTAWKATAEQDANLLMRMRLKQLTNKSHLECDALASCNQTCETNVVAYAGQHFTMVVLENDEYISRTPLCTGHVWESDAVDTILKEMQGLTRGNFLDVGANIGSFSLPIATWMHQERLGSRVISVEANPHTSALLKQSSRLNQLEDTLILHELALVQNSSDAKKICITMTPADNEVSTNPGGNRVNLADGAPCGEEVPAKSLDELVSMRANVMMDVFAVKLDCEGCEGQALMGGRKFLSDTPPCLLAFEVTEQYLCDSGTSLGDLYGFLQEMGYDTSHASMQPKGDGSCQAWKAWAEKNPEQRISQGFEYIRQVDWDKCVSRFN